MGATGAPCRTSVVRSHGFGIGIIGIGIRRTSVKWDNACVPGIRAGHPVIRPLMHDATRAHDPGIPGIRAEQPPTLASFER